MKDILPVIAELLEPVAPVELAYCNSGETFPVIALSLLDNSSSVILSGCDRFSRISMQVDVYAENAESAMLLADEASGILAEKSIRRSFCRLLTDEYRPRVCMRFAFGLDELTGRIVSL